MRLLLLCLASFSVAAHAQAVLVDRIVVVVDLHAITQSAVEERALPRLMTAKTLEDRDKARKESLTELIEDVLIAREALRLGFEVKEDEVERAFLEIAKQNSLSSAQLEAEVARQGLGGPQYRAMLRQKILEMKWLTARSNQAGKPNDPDEYNVFFASERARLVAELKRSAVVEVRP